MNDNNNDNYYIQLFIANFKSIFRRELNAVKKLRFSKSNAKNLLYLLKST